MRFFSSLHRAVVSAVLLMLAPMRAADATHEIQTVAIGFSGALSGVSETFSKSLANAAELAIAESNRANLKLNGKRLQFKLIRMDDRNDPQRAREVAAALVKAGVVGVIGGANSATSIAGSRIYSHAGIPQISPSASVRKYTEPGSRSTFRMVGIDDDACAFLGEYVVKELNTRRIAVIDNGSMFGASVASRFAESAREHGAVIVSRDTVNELEIDFNDLLLRIQSQDVDAVFFGGYTAQTSMLAQTMQRLDLRARLVTTMIGMVGSSFLISTGTAANGTLAQEAGIPMVKIPGLKKFEAEFTQRFDFNLYGTTPYAYDATHVLIAAIRQANSLDPQKIVDTLHQISYKGLTGTIAFDAKGNPRSPSFTIYEAQGQKWVALKSHTVR